MFLTKHFIAITWKKDKRDKRNINPFMTGDTPVCDRISDSVDNINVYVVHRKHFFNSNNSEVDASELLENLEEMFLPLLMSGCYINMNNRRLYRVK